MKKIAFLLAITMFSQAALADCDFSTGITKNNQGYLYTPECHLKVGQLVQDNGTKDQQITDYKKAIDLKDLAITKSDARAQLWMDTSLKLEDRVQNMDSFKKTDEWIHFGLGVLTVFVAGYTAAKLSGR